MHRARDDGWRAAVAIVLLAAAIVSGCAHGTIAPLSPIALMRPTGKVAAVEVEIDSAVEADRRAVYERMEGNRIIAEALRSRLSEEGYTDVAGDTRVDVTVTAFRLRSTANAFWNGFFAGVDKLEGRVDIRQEDRDPVGYNFTLSGSEEWYFKYSAAARFRSLARALAGKVTGLLNGTE